MTDPIAPIRRRVDHPVWLAVVLIGYLFSRLHDITAFPMFQDEGFVLQWAHDSLQGKVLSFGQYGRVLPSWWLALFGAHIGTLLLGRAGQLLIGLIGAAASYAVGRRLDGRRVGWLMLVIVLFAPMLFFFDRMMIPDAMGLSLTALTLWLMSDPKASVRGAVLTAISLSATIFTRATLIVLLVMPLWTALLLLQSKGVRRWRWLTVVYVGTAILCIPLLILFYSHGQNYFLGFTLKGGTSVSSAFSGHISGNFSLFWSAWIAYWGLLFAIGLMLCVAIGLLIGGRRTWWLAGASFPLIAAICIAGSDVTVRYFLVGVWPLILIGVLGIFRLIDRAASVEKTGQPGHLFWLNYALAALVFIWIISWALPFELTAYRTPDQLTLPLSDQQEYMAEEPAGFGIRKAAAALAQQSTAAPIRVIGWLAACSTLQDYLVGVSAVTVECPPVHLTVQDNAMLISDAVARANDLNPPLIVTENLAALPDSALPATRHLIASFPRPDNGRAVELWQLR